MLAGFRWVNLHENLVGALDPPTVRTEAPFWNGTTTNILYGFQIGADGKNFRARSAFRLRGCSRPGFSTTTRNRHLLGAEIRAHEFEQCIARAADFGHQPLADHPAQRVSQTHADLFLLIRLKHARMRLTVSPALIVCRVLRTRWPVSAALKAIFTVS